MLLSLAQWLQTLSPEFGFLRVFQYLTFRAVMAALTALLIGLFAGPVVIRRLTELKIGQPVRGYIMANHVAKSGTPTMGGALILVCIVVTTLLWGDLTNKYVWTVLVVTLTEELALDQARRADREIATGKYRGPLHGIPYAAKDLLAVKGIPTTWGAAPYTNQVFDFDAGGFQLAAQLFAFAFEPGRILFESRQFALHSLKVVVQHLPGGGKQVEAVAQEQRPGQVGRRLGQDVGRVGDDHAARPTGLKIDVVDADGHVGHDPQRRRRSQQFSVDALADQRDKCFRVGDAV